MSPLGGSNPPLSAVDAFLAIASRREVRSFDGRPLPDDVARRILEAGRVSGSAQNKQQWTFFVLSDETRERAAEAVFAPGNLRNAALAVAIVMHGKGPLGFDAGRAAAHMQLAAWNEGVGSVPNGVSDHERMAELLGLDEEQRTHIVLSFGWPAKPADPAARSPEEWIERANRKPFDEVVKRV